MPKLSVIILSYNTSEITKRCLEQLVKSFEKTSFESEMIIIDNASSDASREMISTFSSNFSKNNVKVVSILNKENVGFPKGNNQGLKKANGQFVLFLNSDVMVGNLNWEKVFSYFEKEHRVGAMTIRLELPTGMIDPASHRGFPTVWNSFCYYLGLEKLTAKIPLLNNLFGGYHLTYKNLHEAHEIDSPSGAFFLVRKEVIDNLGGFDETYFMYGEDLDLAFKLKENNYKVVYFPYEMATHLKYSSGLKNGKRKSATKKYFYDAMKIFYKKHYAKKYPSLINELIYFFIGFKSKI